MTEAGQPSSRCSSIEAPKILSPAVAVATTPRSRHNSMAVGGLVGLILGLLAVIASRNGGSRTGGPRVSMALIGRVFGIIGMALSVAALAAVFIAWHGRTGP